MSTRESMRRELKDLAKLAGTLGKEPVGESAPVKQEPFEPSQRVIERPSTPQSLSTFTVPPVIPSTGVEAFVDEEPPRTRKRRGVVTIAIVAGLAAALVGGAQLGRSLAVRLTKPAAKTVAAAALPAPQPAVADIANAVAIPTPAQPTPPATETPSVPSSPVVAPSASSPSLASPKAKISTPHRWLKPSTTPKAAVTTPEGAAGAAASEPAAPKAPAPKPAAAANNAAPAGASGGDSLEDLIRKAVAAPPKK